MQLSTGKYPFNPKFHKFYQSNREKFILIQYGGAGSGKSVSICQDLIMRMFVEKDKRFLVLRKTSPSLRISTFQMLQDLLDEYKLPYYVNRTDMTIKLNGNIMWCRGLDEEQKKKSVNINYAYLEEATEFTHSEFLQIKLRARRENELHNQIYLSFNPVDAFSWVNTELLQHTQQIPDSRIYEGDRIIAMHTTYLDNVRFLPLEYVEELESLKDQDENYYKIYTLGLFGELKNRVYSNYSILPWLEDVKWDETIYGLDFSYNNPTALLEIGIKDAEYSCRERLYQKGMTNQDVIAFLIDNVPKDATIYADSAEPARIQEIIREGFDIHPADKSVKDGIDYVKRQKFKVDESSANLIMELRGYAYKEDKNGNVLDEPVKFRDHLMDCLRYAIYTYAKQQGVITYFGGLAAAFR